MYEGQIVVASRRYAELVWNEERTEAIEVALDRHLLDARVTRRPRLRFTLDYPFEKPFHGEVRADGGATLRQVIQAIRKAYRAICRGSTAEEMVDYDNMRVRGRYGEAVHVIGDLVIESIRIDDRTGQLDVFIGS